MLNNSEKETNLSGWFEDLKPELLGYINKRIRLFKLDSYEKVSIAASILGYGLIVFSIILVILFFTLMGMAMFIGEMVKNPAAGYGIMALFSLVSLGIISLFRRKIKHAILLLTLRIIRKVEANGEE